MSEWVGDGSLVTTDTGHQTPGLQLSPANCTRWRPPEGGQGPVVTASHAQSTPSPRTLIMNKVEPLDQSIGTNSTNSTELPNFETGDDRDLDHDAEMSPETRDDQCQSLEPSESHVRQSTAEIRSDVIRNDDPLPSIQSHHSEKTVKDDVSDGPEPGGHTVIMHEDSHDDGRSQINGHAPVALPDNTDTSPAPDTDVDSG